MRVASKARPRIWRPTRQGVLALSLAFGLALSLAQPPAAAAYSRPLSSSSGQPFAVAKSECSIGNFAEIEPGLARGARLNDAGIEYLRTHGYKTVVAFWTSEGEKERLAKAGIELVSIPIHSNAFGSATPTKAQIETFLKATADPAKRPLFFHCRAGKDRTGAMAAVYRMERHGWKSADAAEEMKAFGFHAHYKNLYRFVSGYTPAGWPVGAAGATVPTALSGADPGAPTGRPTPLEPGVPSGEATPK